MSSMILHLILYSSLPVTVLIVLVYKYLTRNFDYWKSKNVPCLPPTILFGNIKEVLTFKVSFAHHLANLYHVMRAPYFGIYILDKPRLVVAHPDVIKSILVKDFHYFSDRNNQSDKDNDPITSHMLFFSKGEDWKTRKSKMTPLFTIGKLKKLIPLMEEAAETFLNYLENQDFTKSIDAKELCIKYSTDTIVSCVFGINAYSFDPEKCEFINKGKLFFEFSYMNAMQQAAGFFIPEVAKMLRLKVTNPTLTNFLKNVFLHNLDVRQNIGHKRNDLMDVLLEMKKNNILDGDSLIANAVEFFLAGSETTSTTIAFTMYEFCLNKSIQHNAREEIITTKRRFGTWSYEALQSLKYLDMSLNETLRKYPAMAFLDRQCNTDYKLPGYDLVIEKGTAVYIPLLGLHMDPQYFPEPDKYNPERFSVGAIDEIVPCSFLPTGEGPRGCIGRRFGILATKICLVRLLEQYEVCPSEDTPVPIQFAAKSIVLSSEVGLPMKLKRIRS